MDGQLIVISCNEVDGLYHVVTCFEGKNIAHTGCGERN